jgi:hypothetical protein
MTEEQKLLQSLISDIEAMQQKNKNYFGPFDWEDSRDGVIIYWPNLNFLIDRAKDLLLKV